MNNSAHPQPAWTPHFSAVCARLRYGAWRLETAQPAAPGAHSWPRDQVLACAAMLTQLQAQVQQALLVQAQLRQALAKAEQALVQARGELLQVQGRERQALHLAQHDGLTRLANREGFRQRVTEVLGAGPLAAGQVPPAATVAVLFLDLDGMKAVNDQHGHHVGDELLRVVASRLAHAIRGDDLVCRLGGDEFACCLSQPMSRPQLQALAVKLFNAVAAPLQIGPLVLTVQPSIGIAVATLENRTVDALLHCADTAMYQAKRLRSGHAFHASVPAALPLG
jgi:diguanylate cyclase (GGDEF)-like protein